MVGWHSVAYFGWFVLFLFGFLGEGLVAFGLGRGCFWLLWIGVGVGSGLDLDGWFVMFLHLVRLAKTAGIRKITD